MNPQLIIRHLNQQAYEPTWEAMRLFTEGRSEETPDEIWLLQHPPVYTQGQAGKAEHVLNPGDIPVVQTDRGGQVTYHGPGQLIVYVLFDLRRQKLGIRQLVTRLEKSVIQVLSDYGIDAVSKCEAPGVYVNDAKICSIGLRVKRGCSYHGIAFNIDMDLEPFSRINPCGFNNLALTQMKDLTATVTVDDVGSKIVSYITENFGYNGDSFK